MKISYDELEFEWIDDEIEIAYYQDKPYTGIGYETTKKGCYIESVFQNGEVVSEKTWNAQGTVIYDYYKEVYQNQYYDNGILKEAEDDNGTKKYYASGSLKYDYVRKDGLAMGYLPDGIWVFRSKAQKKGYIVLSASEIAFNDIVWYEKYLEMLEEDFGFFKPYFICWIEKCDTKKRPKMVCDMISSENLLIKETGIRMAEKYMIIEAIDYLEKERFNRQIPPAYDGVISTRTISLSARQAIGTLKYGYGILKL